MIYETEGSGTEGTQNKEWGLRMTMQPKRVEYVNIYEEMVFVVMRQEKLWVFFSLSLSV